MTEWKYLPEQDYRIALWRNTIQVPQEVMQPYQRLKPISQTHHEK